MTFNDFLETSDCFQDKSIEIRIKCKTLALNSTFNILKF